ncbi:MAG: DUF262 domain-containing protein [Oscillospiraceae bacterium]|nr:DUF262 domain-containing protein [Oscillospiraceae bacterium]
MIKTVEQTTIADIFSINSDKIYKIPKYQREYTWGMKDWDALFNDVTENDIGYFLGSYICVNSGSLNGTILEVIDGQQRFSTITLLLAALYDKLSAHKSEMDEDEITDLVNLKSELANKKQRYTSNNLKVTEYHQRLFLQKQNSNDEDYSFILSDKNIISDSKTKPANFGNRRIARAYRHFGKLIDDEVDKIKAENSNITDVGALFQIVRKFEAAVLVGIEVDTNKDAYMLFESLNHRGVPLSALDLIKNTLIAQADSSSNADNSYETWKQILSFVGSDDYAVQERFFRQYYNAFREELNEPYNNSDKKYYLGYLATRTTLIDIYEKMIKNDYNSLLKDLSKKAEKYSIIVNNGDDEYEYTEALQNLERISGAPSYILLLYILSNQDALKLSDNNIKEIVNTLITFFVRRNLTDVPNTRKLTQLFIDIVAGIKNLTDKQIVSAIHDRLKEVSAGDSVFEEKLRGSIYDENPEATRFVLCAIEAQYRTKEIYSDLWSRDNSNKYIWTIEHIFPEGENIPACWVNMIADGDTEKAKELRIKHVHTLGNLTITGYNQHLSNMSFDQKRDRKSKDKTKDIGYRNGLHLNSDIVNQSVWTIDNIVNRTNTLVDTLMKMYKW